MLMDPKWQDRIDQLAKPPEPWRTLLLQAANYVQDHGWCQHTLFDNGRVCAVGALASTTGIPPDAWDSSWNDLKPLIQESRARLAQFLGLNSLAATISVPRWNNEPSRTQEEVLAALRGAAGAA